MRAYLDYFIEDALRNNWLIHPNTVAARNELVAAARADTGK